LDKNKLYQSLSLPTSPEALSIEELEVISEKYPWFSTAQVLLSKRYFASNDHRFSEQLHRSAVVVGSRKVLYQLIHKAEHIEPETTLPSPVPAQNIEVRMRFNALEVITTPAEEKRAPIIPQSADTAPAVPQEPRPLNVSQSANNLAELVGDILNEESYKSETPQANKLPQLETTAKTIAPSPMVPPEEITNDPEPEVLPFKASDMDPLERNILVEAVQSSIEQEVGSEREEEEDRETIAGDGYAAWMAKRAEQLHFGHSSSQEEASTPQQAPEAEEETEKEEISEPEENPLLDQIIREATAKKPGASNPKQANLIDRFIKLEPKIAAGKAGEYIPGNIAKESLEEDFSFVTETMAQLFAKQGKFDKARKAYRKLIEQHPEKSVYFAAQLKNLDKLKKG
jgi:hypothetical protein